MSPGPNRRVGTAHHSPPNQRQQPPGQEKSRCLWVALLMTLGAVMLWPQSAMGQNSAPTQPLNPAPPNDLEWGEPLPTDPEDLVPEAETDPSPMGESSDPVYLRPTEACPADYETLVTTLLRDLPSYANRVAARGFRPSRTIPAANIPAATDPDQSPLIPASPAAAVGTMIVASQPDFEPLDLTDRAFGSGLDTESDLRQVFFTTLERQYLSDQAVSLQHFHWLFLVQSEDGWRAVLLYSSLGSYPAADGRLTPPQESSQGIIGQAVRLWLRDCRAGAVFPPAAPNRHNGVTQPAKRGLAVGLEPGHKGSLAVGRGDRGK